MVARPGVSITLGPGWAWDVTSLGGISIHFRGYLFEGERVIEGEAARTHLVSLFEGQLETDGDAQLIAALKRLSGHFAMVVSGRTRTIAVVDRIRSYPLLWGKTHDQILIDDRAPRLSERLGKARAIDQDQALAIAMSGYSIGSGTLFSGVRGLRAGEALVVDDGGHRTIRWFTYDAWRTSPIENPARQLSGLHRFLIERLAKSAAGRVIAIPLSAGLDSRMIASGLKEVGYKNVRLFSYGRPGNHEAQTASAIAERLGYPWRLVPFTTASQRAMFEDEAHAQMWREADCGTSVPFEQDWAAIGTLKRQGYIPDDAIVVNGNSGDYITGAHAPAALMDLPPALSREERRDRVMSAMLKKHFRLWEALATAANDAALRGLLEREAADAGAAFEANEHAAGIHEMLEYQDRQSKYVVSGQRTYEGYGLSWRLPLWDDELIEFFRRLPMEHKKGQNLYKRVLHDDNWGGVWQDLPVNKKTITPRWIIPLRLAAKAAHLPLGPDRWHRFERRVFSWWMDPLRVSAIIPYSKALLDGRGARNSVSWIAETYLGRHNCGFASVNRA